MIIDPRIDVDALIAYEDHMGEQAQAARERVSAMRDDVPLSELIHQTRAMHLRPKLFDMLAQDEFTILNYKTEATFDGPHDQSVVTLASREHRLTTNPPRPLTGDVYKFTNGGQGLQFQQHLQEVSKDPYTVLVCDEIVVDPWQLWRIKAMGFSAAILHIGAQITPDLTASIRVCQEVGLEWMLLANYTHEINEGLAAYQDAFVNQPPLFALGLHFDGEDITHQKVITLAESIPLPNGGQYVPSIFTSYKFLGSIEAGTNPVVNAYQQAGFIGAFAMDSTIRRFFGGQ